ncbi:MAG: PKD domain-containing protein [Candidatus Bipolaricaulis sp.]|nr:PKD domain-containing protein [Candidatus Bipolaricaulis sp.]
MTRTRTIACSALLLACLGLFLTVSAAQSGKNTSPVAAFSAFLAQGSGATVQFDASESTDTDGRIVTYQWVFGDGTTGSGIVKEHAYPRPGHYDVTLLVIDDAGATGMAVQAIDVESLQPRSAKTPRSAPTVAPSVGATSVPMGNRVGQRAPEFSLPGTDDVMVRLSDYAGQVVLLEFWMSTCPACQASMAGLETLRIRYESQGLVVILVSIEQTATAAADFLKRLGYTNLISAIDIYWPTRPTRSAYGVGHIPHAFLIDRSGVIRYSGSPAELSAATIEAWL